MKQLTKLVLFLGLILCFNSCLEDVDQTFTNEKMLGRWNINKRSFGFTTDCERNEYIVFNADSTLLRDQCGQSTGTWYIQDKKLVLNLAMDTTYTNASYTCEFLSENEIKIKLVQNGFIWATYVKQAE